MALNTSTFTIRKCVPRKCFAYNLLWRFAWEKIQNKAAGKICKNLQTIEEKQSFAEAQQIHDERITRQNELYGNAKLQQIGNEKETDWRSVKDKDNSITFCGLVVWPNKCYGICHFAC